MSDQSYVDIISYYESIGLDKDFLALNSITDDEASILQRIIEEKQPKRILEVGTSLGISSVVMALAARPQALVTTIDPNLPLQLDAFTTLQDKSVPVLELTRRMLNQFGLQERVKMLIGYFSCYPSQQQQQFLGDDAQQMKGQIVGEAVAEWAPYDLVFIDGEHFTEAVRSDLFLAQQYVSERATLVLHDVDYSWGPFVRVAIEQFIAVCDDYTWAIDSNLGILTRKL